LSGLIPRGHAEGYVLDTGIKVGFELVDALLGRPRGGEALDEFHAEI
jgi:hypothetical protein